MSSVLDRVRKLELDGNEKQDKDKDKEKEGMDGLEDSGRMDEEKGTVAAASPEKSIGEGSQRAEDGAGKRIGAEGREQDTGGSKGDDDIPTPAMLKAIDTSNPVPEQSSQPILAREPLPEDTHPPDSPTLSLISALRQQISLLTDQSTALNTKLIKSLDRVSDLEDNLEHKRSAEKEKDDMIAQLGGEKAQWEESMKTGLLVERKTVRDEMQKLVEGMLEESRRRGSAEEGRRQVEQEVDELSATLFDEANHMVAAEKMARAQAETRSKQAEENLAAAEAAMRDMQAHLQSLPTLLPAADLSSSQQLVGVVKRKYLAAHVPHTEFIAFIGHVRALKPQYTFPGYSAPAAPTVSTLSGLPFMLRSNNEDVEPTLRLDVAPDLNWLNRKGVLNAIINGELIIEPISVNSLLSSSTYTSHSGEIGCSMCGKPVFARAAAASESLPPPVHPAAARATSNARFSLKPFFSSPSAPSPSVSPVTSPNPNAHHPSNPPVFIFRINVATAQSNEKEKESLGRVYPLCATGWCLGRLRTVCEWWRFIRTGLIEVIWKGEDGWQPSNRPSLAGSSTRNSMGAASEQSAPPTPKAVPVEVASVPEPADGSKADEERPELPPRKKTSWGLGFKGLGSGKGLGIGKETTPPQSPVGEKTFAEGGLLEEKQGSRPTSSRTTSDSSNVPATIDETQDEERAVGGGDAQGEKKAEGEQPVEVVVVKPENDEVEGSTTRRSSISQDSDGESNANAFATPINRTPSQSVLDLSKTAGERVGNGDGGETEDTTIPKVGGDDQAVEIKREDSGVPTPTTPALDLSSPRPSADLSPAVRSSIESGKPPPTPPRSAARRPAPANPSNSAVPPLPARNQSRPTSLVAHPESAEATQLKSPQLPSTPEPGVTPATPEPSTATSNTTTPQAVLTKPAPTPPPRHPGQRASLAPGTSAPSRSGKRFVEGDAWEAKTWREIVRLKEDMWRARVGLVEDDES